MDNLHPNWQKLIEILDELQYGQIRELTFEKGIPVNFKLAVKNINLGAEVKKDSRREAE